MPSPFRSAGFRWVVFAPFTLAVFVVSFLFVTFHLMRAAATPKRDKVVAELDAADPTWRTTALTAERNAKLPRPNKMPPSWPTGRTRTCRRPTATGR